MIMFFIIIFSLLLSWFILSTYYSSVTGEFIIQHFRYFLTGKKDKKSFNDKC